MPHILTLTGATGSGKSETVNFFLKGESLPYFKPQLVSKYTTRSPRLGAEKEAICVNEIPPSCDLVYEQYQVRYGLEKNKLFELLSCGFSPIVILNDVRVVEDVRASFGNLVRSIFIFRERPSLDKIRMLAEERGNANEQEIQRRFRKAETIFRIYIENIHIFDHVILNPRSFVDLESQVQQIVKSLKNAEQEWPLQLRRNNL
jgi:hypothetical protein